MRSYEFYEVRAEIHGLALTRGSEKTCRDWLNRHAHETDAQESNLYLYRCTLVEAAKADKK
jgi:hypothetical protein